MKRLMTMITVAVGFVMVFTSAWCNAAEGSGQGNNGAAAILRGGKLPEAAKGKADQRQPILRSTADKRRWLRETLARGSKDPRQTQQLQAAIDRLTPQQLDVLAKAVLAQQLPAAGGQQPLQPGLAPFDLQQQQLLQQANQELARAQLIRQALENEWWWRNAGYGVGYMPIITWLPQGTSFGAGATISPDGRYVRTTVNPFFSSIGPVYTYNLNTGETRPWMPQPSYSTNTNNPNPPLGDPGFDRSTVGIPPFRRP